MVVPKKDGPLRFCVDCRGLNAISQRDSYPIRRIDECLDSLGDARVFTTLYFNSLYGQVEIEKPDRNKTTSTSHFVLYRLTRMPFGLRKSRATFQRAVDIILPEVQWRFAPVSMDDVIVYSNTFKEHTAQVRTVLRLLQTAGKTRREMPVL